MNIPGGVVPAHHQPGRRRSRSCQSDAGRGGRVAAARHASIRFARDRRLTAATAAAAPDHRLPGDDRRMATPDDRRYTDQHEWALVQGTDGDGDRRPGRHHRPRPGRARRHRLRPAAGGGRRGRPRHADRRGGVDQVGVRRLRAGRRRRGRRQRRARRRARRRSTPIPYGAGWLVEISVAGEGGDPDRRAARRRRLPGAGRRVLTGPPPGCRRRRDHYDRAEAHGAPGDQRGTHGSAP